MKNSEQHICGKLSSARLDGMAAACLALASVNPFSLEVPEGTTDQERVEYIEGWKSIFDASDNPWSEVLEMFEIPQ